MPKADATGIDKSILVHLSIRVFQCDYERTFWRLVLSSL
jgi:hypothetical protein